MLDKAVSFRTSTGRDAEHFVAELGANLQPRESDLQLMLERQKARILERTAAGLDVDGNPWEPYKPRYAKFRTSKGRKTSPVTLLFTGRMLQAITVVIRNATECALGIYASDVTDRARGNQARRRFFGASTVELRLIAEDLLSSIRSRLK